MTKLVRSTLLALLTVGVSLLYFPLNRPHGVVHILALPIDWHIPEVPIFVVPYIFGFSLMILAGGWYLLHHQTEAFARLCLSIIVANLIAFFIYLVFQTAVPRSLTTDPSIFGQILNWIRKTDRIYSAFPSGHTFLTTIFTWHLWPALSRRWRPVLLVNAVLIILATLLLRQHYLVDPIAGLVLGLGVSWGVGRLWRGR